MVDGVESFAHVYGDGDGAFRWFLLIETGGDGVVNFLQCSGGGVFGFEAVLRSDVGNIFVECWEDDFLECFSDWGKQ